MTTEKGGPSPEEMGIEEETSELNKESQNLKEFYEERFLRLSDQGKRELYGGLKLLADEETGIFLRDLDDLKSMIVLVGDVFPRLDAMQLEGEAVTEEDYWVPVSNKDLLTIGKKLVADGKTTNTTLDRAVYETLVEIYKMSERPTAQDNAKAALEALQESGLLLGDDIKDDIVNQGLITAEEFDAKAAEFQKK